MRQFSRVRSKNSLLYHILGNMCEALKGSGLSLAVGWWAVGNCTLITPYRTLYSGLPEVKQQRPVRLASRNCRKQRKGKECIFWWSKSTRNRTKSRVWRAKSVFACQNRPWAASAADRLVKEVKKKAEQEELENAKVRPHQRDFQCFKATKKLRLRLLNASVISTSSTD